MTVSSINNGLEGILPSNPLPKESIQALYATAYDLYNNGKYEESKSFFHFYKVKMKFGLKVPFSSFFIAELQ